MRRLTGTDAPTICAFLFPRVQCGLLRADFSTRVIEGARSRFYACDAWLACRGWARHCRQRERLYRSLVQTKVLQGFTPRKGHSARLHTPASKSVRKAVSTPASRCEQLAALHQVCCLPLTLFTLNKLVTNLARNAPPRRCASGCDMPRTCLNRAYQRPMIIRTDGNLVCA